MYPIGKTLPSCRFIGVFFIILFAPLALSESKILPQATPASVGMSEIGLKKINTIVQKLIDTNKIPGAVTMVARHGKLIHLKSQGYADVENKTPIGPDTIFRLMSMTKPITSAAIVMLYDDGLIGLDDPIKNYLPEFTKMYVRSEQGLIPAKGNITIRQLLTHTSGLAYASLPSVVTGDYKRANVFAIDNRLSETTEAHVKRLAKLPLVAHPGTVWNYGESMAVLGRLVEVVSGKSFRSFLKERLLNPLEMHDTDFYVAPENKKGLAQLYEMGSAGVISNVDPNNYGGSYFKKPLLEYGGAGLVGTPYDYLRFAQMFINGGKSKKIQLISVAGIKMLMSDNLPASVATDTLALLLPLSGVDFGFGFGGSVVVGKESDESAGSVGEYSWGGWANTLFWVDPEQELVGLVFTQVIPASPSSVNLGVELGAAIRKATYDAIIEKR
jgi:CubicO group peptidase (beta-lactamase class C family)